MEAVTTPQPKTQGMTITKDMTISSVVQQHPEVVDTLMGFGVHCVGCSVSEWETLEQGFSGHGMADDEITNAVAKLNEVVDNHKTGQKEGEHLSFTELAITKIKDLCQKNNKKALRVTVEAGGCAGFSYGFSLTDKQRESDETYQEHGVTVFIEKQALEMMEGSVIDYVDALQGAGFKVSNPMAKKHCGCGTSFG